MAAIAQKMRDDLAKIGASGMVVVRVYFCTTSDPSEYTLDQLAAELQNQLPGVAVEPLNAEQMARLSVSFPAALRKHYATELRDYLAFLHAETLGGDNGGNDSLLLALATSTHANSAAVRAASYQQITLRALPASAEPRGLSVNEVSVELQRRLKLARPIPPAVVRKHLLELVSGGLAGSEDDRFRRLASGDEFVASGEETAFRALHDGRVRFRASLEESLKQSLSDDHFASIWTTVERKLAHFFYTQGFRMIHAVNTLTGESAKEADPSGVSVGQPIPFFVDDLAVAVAATTTGPQLRVELEQAVRDIFVERRGSAFAWIVSVCTSFVLACMLGLEETSGARLREAIGTTYLVLDTDIVLELLGVGEPGHESARELVAEWRRLGGRVLLAEPVLEEVTHHAWISQRDFDEVSERFLLTEQDRRRFVRNVFVRAFGHLVEHRKAGFHQ